MQHHSLTRLLAVVLFCLAILICILHPVAADDTDTRMNQTKEEIEAEFMAYDNVSPYKPVSSIAAAPSSLTNEVPKTSFSDWNQGDCGNCWVWAGTGTLAQTLYKSTGTSTPISIQFFNSNYMNGNINMIKPHLWACTGGFPYTFADIYNTGVNQSYPGGPFVVPWNNYNASYKDGGVKEPMDYNQTTLPKNLITTTPNVGLERIDPERAVAEPYSNQTAAVENITRSLVDGKVVYYTMYLPNRTAWDQFSDNFWANQPNVFWDMDAYNQSYYNDTPNEGSGHAMILIGYNKTDSSKTNQYWIVQNSWGTNASNPRGQYRLKMWMDYNASFSNNDWQMQQFWVFNTTWKTDPVVSGISPTTGQPGTVTKTDISGTNIASSADLMLKSASISPRHGGSLLNGTGVALLGDPFRVTISGNYAYITGKATNSLEIVNLTNPFIPVHEGIIVNGTSGALLDGPVDVAVSGKYAYVASFRSNAIEIIDISKPSAPVYKGRISHGTGGALLMGPQRVAVSGNLTYVASSNSNALEILNTANPAAPVHYASLANGVGGALLDTPYDLELTDDYPYAYVASSGSNALEIVNITNPAAPTHMGSVSNGVGGALLSEPQSVTVAGYNAFVTSKGNDALEIVDISNQSAPVHRGSLAKTAGDAYLNGPVDAIISSDWKYAYVASNTGSTLDIIDVSDPAAPVYKAGISNRTAGTYLDSPTSVALYRSLAYVTSYGNDALEVVAVDSIPATGILVSPSTGITGSFNLTGAPLGTWDVVVTNVNSRFSTLSRGFSVAVVPTPTPTPPPYGGDDIDEDETGLVGKEAGASGQASVSLKTNELGQTLAPYTVETTTASPIDVEVSIPQSTKSLTAAGTPISEVTVTPLSVDAVDKITAGAALPEGTAFTAGGLGVECTPSGATFSQPVTISFTMTRAQWDDAVARAGGKAEDITIQYYNTQTKTWAAIPTTIDRTTRTITGSTKHFTLFAVFVKTAAASVPTRATYSWETPTPAAVIHTTAPVIPTATPVPAPVQSQPQFSIMTIVAIIAGIVVLIGIILVIRRWWIRRQNPALFRKYD
ncbi:C1 family peptidase [uncultured Methanoregula sp.]|uniref:C1 family peptidase n=1 Tax=uncultured Methanoregula sp. TaxID=1005933 RepID=UPI002AAAD2EA|nr:C1 family peptidase [uncultured Methanoregula sp.]